MRVLYGRSCLLIGVLYIMVAFPMDLQYLTLDGFRQLSKERCIGVPKHFQESHEVQQIITSSLGAGTSGMHI